MNLPQNIKISILDLIKHPERIWFKLLIEIKLFQIKNKYKLNTNDISFIRTLQNKIYYEIFGDHSQKNECRDIYYILMCSRLYQINREMVDLLVLEKFHSCNALCRIICEILMVTSYVNIIDMDYSKIISGEKEGKNIEFRDIIKKVKRSNKKPNYWDDLRKHWCLFSEYLHPKISSFKDSVWWLKNENNEIIKSCLFVNRPNKNEQSSAVIIHTYPSYVPEELKQIIINCFFSYSYFILKSMDQYLKEMGPLE